MSVPISEIKVGGSNLMDRIEGKARAVASRARSKMRIDDELDDSARLLVGVGAIHAQKAARSTFRHLWDAEVSIFSQWGEDGIFDFLCDSLDLARPRALELGAGNFVECNTRFLAHYRSASVVAVDGRNDLASTIKSLDISWKTTIMALEQWITPENAPEICEKARQFMGGIDIVSLDIDGNDYWVAQALDLTDVRIIVVEYNSLFGPTAPVTVPRNDMFDRTQAHYSYSYWGASIRAFVDLFQKTGFALIGTNRACTNAFFVRREDASAFDQLDLPVPGDLASYTDCRVREGRDSKGELSYAGASARRELIQDMPILNVQNSELTTLAALPG